MELIKDLPPEKLSGRERKSTMALFICSFCGLLNKKPKSDGLKNRSCGCQKDEHKKSHGDGTSKNRLYRCWKSIKCRCLTKSTTRYDRYGGRGITMCKEWVESFAAFRSWALKNGYEETLTIDRTDNDGNYEPSNCRWVTKRENNRNRNTKLNMAKAEEIRELYKTGNYTQEELGKMYNVSKETARSVIIGELWV